MDFNSSYYSIMVFSQQLFVYKIFSLQDLYVQSQETSLNSFIIIWFNLHINAALFTLGVFVYVYKTLPTNHSNENDREPYKLNKLVCIFQLLTANKLYMFLLSPYTWIAHRNWGTAAWIIAYSVSQNDIWLFI